MRIAAVASAICCTVAGLAAASEADAAIRKPTNIPAQALEHALQTFAKERDLQVVYRSEVVGDLRTSGATGELTVHEALKQLLKGTGLTLKYLDEKIITIVPVAVSKNVEAERTSFWQRITLAQTSPRDDAEAERQSGAAAEKAQGLEEVIVTAQKRAERIQDVPMSMTAIGSEEIERRRLVSAGDYLRGIPGVTQVDDSKGGSIVIRGIETAGEFQGSTSGATVATYFGETPTTNTAGISGNTNIDIKLVDIERVEVLRGPQGTAFGNSSLGGAVRTIPAAPRADRFEGKAAAEYSATSATGGGSYNLQAVANIPLLPEKVAVRAVAYRYEDSGYYTNIAASDPALQALATRYGAQAFAVDEREVGSSQFTGGRIAASFQPIDSLKFTLSYLTQETEIDGLPLATAPDYRQSVFQIAPEHVISGHTAGVTDQDIDILSATVEYDLGWGALLATYSDIDSGTTTVAPQTFVLPWSALGDSTHGEHSGELRLTTRFDGPFNFLAGVYAEKLEDDRSFNLYWYGSPETSLAPGQRFLGNTRRLADVKHQALFSEVSWEFAPGLTLTGGARRYDYDRKIQDAPSGPLFGGTGAFGPELRTDASGTVYRGNLSYKLNADALLYASWSQGFRLGKPQTPLPAGLCDRNGDGILDGSGSTTLASTGRVEPDSLDNYELGTKLELLDRRLTLTADVFRIEWEGMPFVTSAPGTAGSTDGSGCGLTYTANAGAARSEGVEIQATMLLTPSLRAEIGGSRINAELTEDVPRQGLRAGARLLAPKVNANLSLQYDFAFNNYDVFVRADSIYVGDFYGSLTQNELTRAGDYIKVDASLGVTIRHIDFNLFVTNLTNIDDFTWRGVTANSADYGYLPRPRTFGLRLNYDF